MAALVKQVADELDGSYPECPIESRRRATPAGAWDADRLGQVLSNLVANALQHGVPAAGVRGVHRRAGARGGLRAGAQHGRHPPGADSPVFDPLTGGQRRRDRSQGLGLGLFITKRIAAAHGGDVDVSSSESEGTTFALSLPRFADGAAHTDRDGRPGIGASGRRAHRVRRSTWRRLAQDQLRDSEARFRLLVEAVKDYAIFMLDPERPGHDLERRRRSGSRATRRARSSASTSREFYEPEEVRAGKCERELEGAARDGRFEDEGWRVRKDGTRFWANVVITALRDENGELVGFAKVTRDLTERRQLEQEQLRPGPGRGGDSPARRVPVAGAHELKTPLTVLQLQLDT